MSSLFKILLSSAPALLSSASMVALGQGGGVGLFAQMRKSVAIMATPSHTDRGAYFRTIRERGKKIG